MTRLAVYGDSLALPRKTVVSHEQRYISLLQNWLITAFKSPVIEIKDRTKGGTVITELLEMMQHDLGYFDFPGDILVIHCGIVDCAPRPIDEKRREQISKLPGFIKYRIIKYLHNNRSRILSKGKHYVKTKQSDFELLYTEMIRLGSENYKRVYVVNICPTNADIEAHSPGFTKNINNYNASIAKVLAAENKSNVKLIDVHNHITTSGEIDTYVLKEDGHHITPLTHAWIAEQIIRQEQANHVVL